MYLGHVCEILIHTLWAPQDVASCIYSEAKQGERDEDDDCKDTHQPLRNTHTNAHELLNHLSAQSQAHQDCQAELRPGMHCWEMKGLQLCLRMQI